MMKSNKSEKKYETRRVFWIDGMQLAHQIAENEWGSFAHRIALVNGYGDVCAAGGMSCYQHPAFFKPESAPKEQAYMVVTQYYEGEPLEHEVVYRLTRAKDVDR